MTRTKTHLISLICICATVLLLAHTVHANHFRSGFMSWEAVDGDANTVLLKVEVGWTNDHGQIPTTTAVGEVVEGAININFGDGQTHSGDLRVTSRNTTTNDVQTELVSIKDGEDEYTAGVEHTYASEGDYVAYWGSSARESALNQDSSTWRNETKINIGGTYSGNSSPISAVPSVIQVPDNQIFSYDLVGVDTDGDDVEFRYGTQDEFYNNGVDTEATKPTGLVLGSDGSVSWDVRDTEVTTAIGDRWQMTVMAEDLDTEGNMKSYIPLDFVLKISDSSDLPPSLTVDENSYTVDVADTLNFSLVATDPDWTSGDSSPVVSVVNPPSADASIWAISNTVDDAIATSTVSFTPNADMNGDSYVVVFQATDDAGNATTKSVTVNVNLDETAPVISNVALATDSTAATTTWTTGEAGSSQVVYGPTDAYGASTTIMNTDPRVTEHSVPLNDLAACTTYHYAVVSTDLVGNTATSSDDTFTTSGCAGEATPASTANQVLATNATGTASSTVGETTITVDTPENVTSTSSSLVIQILSLDSTTALGAIGTANNLNSVGDSVFDVKAIINGTTILDSFDAPVTITYTYTDDEVAEFDESTLTLYNYHDGAWKELDNCSLDIAANTISCTTDAFSIFALFGETVSTSSGGGTSTRFGCTDTAASNYQPFSSHKQSLCTYANDETLTSTETAENDSGTNERTALQERISELQQQLATLQNQTNRNTSTSTNQLVISSTGCVTTFTRHLEQGMQGEDVRCLQQAMNALGFTLAETGPGSPGNETIYFSSLTDDAVRRYQEANREQVLTPIGLDAPTGYVGRQTTNALREDNPLFEEQATKSDNPLSGE